MNKTMKKVSAAACAVLTVSVAAFSAFAADYSEAPIVIGSGNESSTSASSTTSDDVSNAISSAVETPVEDSEEGSEGETKKVATIETKTTSNTTLSADVVKTMAETGTTIEIKSKKATITIDPSTITKVGKLNLSMTVKNNSKQTVVKFTSKKDFNCEVQVEVTSCKLSPEELAVAHVYCNGEDLGPVEINDAGNPVITVTKGGEYVIK